MNPAGIAIGSNLPPREEYIALAFEWLRDLDEGSRFLRSAVYETQPVDCTEGSAHFLNAAVQIQTSLEAPELLARLHALERAAGRPEVHHKNHPRTLDLDLLYLGDTVLVGDSLTLPHPRIVERAFVMIPLAEIVPDLVLPGQHKSVRDLCTQLPDQGVRRWKSP